MRGSIRPLADTKQDEQGSLFTRLALPPLYKEELLYSWCGRFHQLSCNISPKHTSRQLFGDPTAALRLDFPAPLNTLHGQVDGQLGTLDDLLQHHTLFGFYRPFLPKVRADALMAEIRSGSHTKARNALGLTASLPGSVGTLKVCPACMEEDSAHVPSGWWRTEQQWPGMFVCRRHQIALWIVENPIAQQAAKSWMLPRQIPQTGWRKFPEISHATLLQLMDMSRACRSIGEVPGLHLETAKLRFCYLLEANDKGYVSMDGSMRMWQLRDEFLDWAGELPRLPLLAFAGQVRDVNAGFLGQLLRRYPGVRHPLKHLILIAYLFPSAEAFFARYRDVSETLDAEGEVALLKRLTSLRTELVHLVSNEGRSVNSVASELGASVTQAIKFLNKEKVPYGRRPRIVGTDKERELVAALQEGRERVAICQMLEIRNSYIKDYLAAHPVLRATWEVKSFERRREGYRERFLKVLQEHPGWSIKAIRLFPGSGYQWLCRNDRVWLTVAITCYGCSI